MFDVFLSKEVYDAFVAQLALCNMLSCIMSSEKQQLDTLIMLASPSLSLPSASSSLGSLLSSTAYIGLAPSLLLVIGMSTFSLF